MDKKDQAPKIRRRRGSWIWYTLNRSTARFYATLRQSSWGRFMTSYRRRDGQDGRSGAGCKPPSPARQRLVGAVEASRLVRGGRALLGGLFDLPTACYGVFGMLYGLFSLLISLIGPRILDGISRSRGEMFFSALVVLCCFPLLFSKGSLSESLGHSSVARRLLVDFLGIPRDRLTHIVRRIPAKAWPPALLWSGGLGILASAATLITRPWMVPLILLGIALVGMILAYPETGVVLLTLMLPLLWLDNRNLVAVVILILLTWCSYGFHLLTLSRAIRFERLDWVFLILGGMTLIMGFTGYGLTADSIWQSVALTVCISGYFLIVNLASARAMIHRCLVGVGISVVVVTTLAYIRRIPIDSLLWLEGSRAGDAIIAGVDNAMTQLTQMWVDHAELYLVLAFSWLYAYLLHTKRILRKFMGALFVVLDFTLILLTDSVTAMLCVVIVTILFLLMLGHKWLSAGLLSLPAVICGVCWAQYWYPVSDALLTILSRSRLYKSQLLESLWRMVLDHPAGIGVGSDAFQAVYPAYAAPDLGGVTDCGSAFFEILLGYGWVGLLVWAFALIFFLQKSFSALGCTLVVKDRAMILGGVTSLLGLVIMGSVRSFITSPRVFFTIMLVIALCSAYENVIFEERDMERATWVGCETGEDRVYRN